MNDIFNAILAIIFIMVFVMFIAVTDDVIDIGQLRKSFLWIITHLLLMSFGVDPLTLWEKQIEEDFG